MLELVSATVYALTLAVFGTMVLSILYYLLALCLMNLARRLWGEDHRGYYFLNLLVVLVFITFLLLFSFFARSFR
jgi:hypothetical protein